MSDSNGPVRRRRIAGEAKPAAPAKKAVVKKAAAKKTPVQKSAAVKKSATAAPVPVAKKAPAVKKAPATKSAPAAKKSEAVASVPVAKKPIARPKQPSTTKAKAPALAKPARPITSQPRPEGPRRTPTGRDLRWLVPSALVAVAALVVGVLLFVGVLGGKSGGSDGVVASNRQAASAAASAAETIFSFDYDKLDEHLTASKALMTPAFAKDFDKIAPALTELAPQRKIQVKAVARDSAALPCGDECSTTKANVLVFVDQARLVGDSKEPTVFANRISVSMVKEDDGWRVANIRAL